MSGRGFIGNNNILIIDPVSSYVLEQLKKVGMIQYCPYPSEQELTRLIQECNILILRSGSVITPEMLNRAKNLKIIARAGVGLDNIPIKEAKEKGIEIFNLPAISARSVAELALGLTVSLSRKLLYGHQTLSEGKWLKAELEGRELLNKNAGLIGFGRIGKEICRLYQAIGMKTLTFRRANDELALQESIEWNTPLLPLEQLLQESDVITMHVPLTSETRDLIGWEQFLKMKKHPIIINMARWEVINQADLVKALEHDLISGIAIDPVELDKLDKRLLQFPNVILTPHIGAHTLEAQQRIGRALVDKILTILSSEDSLSQGV